MNRQQANQDLVDILQYLVEINPDLRFSQILYNYGFVKPTRPKNIDPNFLVEWQNEFYIEPIEVLTRVERRLDE